MLAASAAPQDTQNTGAEAQSQALQQDAARQSQQMAFEARVQDLKLRQLEEKIKKKEKATKAAQKRKAKEEIADTKWKQDRHNKEIQIIKNKINAAAVVSETPPGNVTPALSGIVEIPISLSLALPGVQPHVIEQVYEGKLLPKNL